MYDDASKKTFSTKLMRLMKKESELPENVVDGFVQVRSTFCNDDSIVNITQFFFPIKLINYFG